MKKLFLPFSLALTVLLGACEKEVTGIKLPESDAKLVVNSFISPQDTAWRVTLYQSVPTLGVREPTSSGVAGALVTVTDGNQTVTLPNQGDALYELPTSDFPVVAGRTYTLRVQAPDGKTVEAACTVPGAPEDFGLVIDSLPDANGARTRYYLRLNWTDAGGQENYYRLAGEIRREWKEVPANAPPTLYPLSINWEGETFLDDKGKDGQTMYSPKGELWALGPGSTNTRVYLQASLLHTDRHYYQYHLSARNAIRNRDNPFAEPTLVYSNVTGGLGIFAAYNRTTFSMQLR